MHVLLMGVNKATWFCEEPMLTTGLKQGSVSDFNGEQLFLEQKIRDCCRKTIFDMNWKWPSQQK